jgi:hypothetical protein
MTVDAARPMLERRDYKGDQCSLDTDVGALAHIVSLSHEAGLDNRLPDTLYAVYAAAVAAGLEAKELPPVYANCSGRSALKGVGEKQSSPRICIVQRFLCPHKFRAGVQTECGLRILRAPLSPILTRL